MNRLLCILSLTTLAVFTSCSANMSVRRLPVGSLADISGLVVNQNAPHEVIAVFRESPNSDKLTTERAAMWFASADELCEIDYSGALFTNRTLEVEVHADSTLKRAKISTEVTLPGDLAAIQSSLESVAKVREDAESAKDEPDPLESENEDIARRIRNLMLQRNLDALEAGQALPFPDL